MLANIAKYPLLLFRRLCYDRAMDLKYCGIQIFQDDLDIKVAEILDKGRQRRIVTPAGLPIAIIQTTSPYLNGTHLSKPRDDKTGSGNNCL